jgi:hypothetical protein
MKNYPDIGIQVADLLLPKNGINMTQWSVIACDQYTSQPEYWENVKKIVGDSPSTLNLILPEVFLGKPEEEKQTELTRQKMAEYLSGDVFVQREGIVLVERKVDNKTRHGLVLALDLEKYDYNKGSKSLIRATEGTILHRLPPRIKIREGAPLELPHILVLIDDPDCTVIEPFISRKAELEKIYNFNLMLGSGHLSGYFLNQESQINQLVEAIRKLADAHVYSHKYGVDIDTGVLLFAMGDGNHSLATAKAIWEKNKAAVGMDHPSRYALVEIENIHDSGLEFEPIHRVLFELKENPLTAMRAYYQDNFRLTRVASAAEMKHIVDTQKGGEHAIGIIQPDGFSVASISNPQSNLPVGTIQAFLDEWVNKERVKDIDYVHGAETVVELGTEPGNLGIYLPAMEKSDLFKTVILDGALPRKTFSMGEAHEKRFYLECRRIA